MLALVEANVCQESAKRLHRSLIERHLMASFEAVDLAPKRGRHLPGALRRIHVVQKAHGV